MQKAQGSNSITPTRILRNPALKQYAILTKAYGVFIQAYKPLNIRPNSAVFGNQDELNQFEKNPYYVGKAIIPSIFRRRNAVTLANLDPFIDSDKYLYIADDINLEVYSLIVCKLASGKILNFKINDIDEDGNDAGSVVKRYALVPYISSRPMENLKEIKSHLKAELENEDLNVSDSITNNSNNSLDNIQSNGFIYKPL